MKSRDKRTPTLATFTELLMRAARAKAKLEPKTPERTPVKIRVKRIEDKARTSGAVGRGKGTPGRKKAKDKLLSPRQKRIKDFFEKKLHKVGQPGLSRESKDTSTIQGTSNSPLKGVLDN